MTDKATFIVLWQPPAGGAVPIGPFDHFDEAFAWKVEHLNIVPEERVRVQRVISPCMESITIPKAAEVMREELEEVGLNVESEIPAFLRRCNKDV